MNTKKLWQILDVRNEICQQQKLASCIVVFSHWVNVHFCPLCVL